MAYISGDQGIKVVESSKKESLLSYQFEHFAHQNDLDEPKEYTKKMARISGHISQRQGKQRGDLKINAGNRLRVIGSHQHKNLETLLCQEIAGIQMKQLGKDKKQS